MGVSLEYLTASTVSDDVASAIAAAAREPNSQPWIQCEPICFLDVPGFEQRMFGCSKLNLMPHPDDLAEAAGIATEKDDLTFLLDQLCRWSREFEVDWIIQIEGEALGFVRSGICEPQVREAIEALSSVAGELGELGGFGDLDEYM